jgi:hypothetical protein
MLEPLHYTHRQKNVFGAMDPNVKIMFEELSKLIRAKIKDGFIVHEVTFESCLEGVNRQSNLKLT